MKRTFNFIANIALVAFLLVSCDSHVYIDSSVKVGDVLCDDHRIMSLSSYRNQSTSKAVGVIFATSSEDTPVLAVTLDEMSPSQFCTVLGQSQGTSCSLTAYDGFENTTSLQHSIDTETGLASPMADAVFRAGAYGQSMYIPSVAELRLLISNLPEVNPVLESLGGHPITTSPSGGDCWYWSSTEVSINKGYQAWLVSAAAGGACLETPKDASHLARTIVAIYH